MIVSEIKMSAEQFDRLGEDPPGVRLELVHGEIHVSPSPSYEHSYVDTRLRALLFRHIDELNLGELVGDVDTRFDDFNVRRPDIIFTAKSRLHLRDKTKHGIRYAPDLCIEIVSPGSATMDQTDKFKLYAASGVAHYWIVDPQNRTFRAFKLVGDRYEKVASGSNSDSVSAEPFPALSIPLKDIWATTDTL